MRTVSATLVLFSVVFGLACSGVPNVNVTWVDPEQPPSEPLPMDPAALPPGAGVPTPGGGPVPSQKGAGHAGSASIATPAGTAVPAAPQSNPVAAKGEIQVSTVAAVVAYVDGRVAVYDVNEGYVIRDLLPGKHQLEIQNALAKTVAETDVNVLAGQRSRFRYKTGGRLEDLGAVVAPAPPAPTPVVATTTTLPAASGSLQIEGLSTTNARVWVDGSQVLNGPGSGSAAVGGLIVGLHPVRVESAGQVVYDGQLEIRTGQNNRCLADNRYYPAQLSCHFTTPAVVGTSSTVSTVSATVNYGGAQVSVQSTPAVSNAPSGSQVITSSDLDALIASVRASSFSDDKLAVLRSSAKYHMFTCAQVARLVDALSFADDKVEAVRILRSAIVDPQNAYVLNSHFTFSDDQAEVQAMFL